MLLFINTNLIRNYTTLFKKKRNLERLTRQYFALIFFSSNLDIFIVVILSLLLTVESFPQPSGNPYIEWQEYREMLHGQKKQHTAEAFLHSLNQEKFKYYQATHVRELIPHTLLSSKLGSVKLYNRGKKKGILYCKLLALQHLEASRSCTEILQPARLQKGL